VALMDNKDGRETLGLKVLRVISVNQVLKEFKGSMDSVEILDLVDQQVRLAMQCLFTTES